MSLLSRGCASPSSINVFFFFFSFNNNRSKIRVHHSQGGNHAGADSSKKQLKHDSKMLRALWQSVTGMSRTGTSSGAHWVYGVVASRGMSGHTELEMRTRTRIGCCKLGACSSDLVEDWAGCSVGRAQRSLSPGRMVLELPVHSLKSCWWCRTICGRRCCHRERRGILESHQPHTLGCSTNKFTLTFRLIESSHELATVVALLRSPRILRSIRQFNRTLLERLHSQLALTSASAKGPIARTSVSTSVISSSSNRYSIFSPKP